MGGEKKEIDAKEIRSTSGESGESDDVRMWEIICKL